jgi:hypothetical protein
VPLVVDEQLSERWLPPLEERPNDIKIEYASPQTRAQYGSIFVSLKFWGHCRETWIR